MPVVMRVQFDTDNAAFAGDALQTECAAILEMIANRLDEGRVLGICKDSYGNIVGEWSVTP